MASDTRIVSIGACAQDVFLIGSALAAKRDVRTNDYVEQFPLGAKIDIDQVVFATGGGACNASVTFARQGLESVFASKIGKDSAGAEILYELQREGVKTTYVAQDNKLTTGYSTLLVAPNGERTILSYRGASHNMQAADYPIKNIRADWFYITSLAGNMDLLKRLLKHANTHEIQVALNPGLAEIASGKKLRALLPLVTVLLANREEMAELFHGDNPRDLLQTASRHCQYAVLTDGPNGSWATDGNKIYQSGQYKKVKVLDRTGAGDAFGSGFVAALAKNMALPDALTLASANSTSVVQHYGSKPGILKTQKLKPMPVKVSDL